MSKVKSTSGFIYIWYDRKHRRYYVGSHWGTPDDGYVCSSSWMMAAYGRRPQDFKRKILKVVTGNRNDLLREEHRWLQMIKPEEMGSRYYNRFRSSDWKDGVLRDAKISGTKKGKKFSDEHRAALSEAHKGIRPSEETRKKRSESLRKAHAEGRHSGMRGKKWDEIATPERLAAKAAATSEGLKKRAQRLREETGKGLSEDHIRKIKDSGFGQHWKGKTRSPETIERMAAARRAYWERRRQSVSSGP